MKKIFFLLISTFILVGCNMMNTPTKKVEQLLEKYQMLSDDVLNDLDYIIDGVELLQEQKETYKELMKRQYKELNYIIKEERIDGDFANVTVEIEVYDYGKAIMNADSYLTSHQEEFLNEDESINRDKFIDYKIEQMQDVKDRIKYTLDLSLTKVDDEWHIDDLTEIDRQKIHGIYSF